MPLTSRQRACLDAMGIPVWQPRQDMSVESAEIASPVSAPEPDSSVPETTLESSVPPPLNRAEASDTAASKPVSSANQQAKQTEGAPAAVDEDIPAWMNEAPPFDDADIPDYDDEAVMEPDVAASPATSQPQPVDDIGTLDWPALKERVSHCQHCKELAEHRTQTVFGVGDEHANLLIIGEAPGADEDRQGEPFVGKAGQLLTQMIKAVGLKREQVYIANVLKCRPPNNRDPKPEEVAFCEHYLRRQIALIQPKAILMVGRVAAQNLLANELPIGKLRGKLHHYHEANIPVVVTYHPAYLLRSPSEKQKSWQDLKQLLALLRGTTSQ